MGCSSAGASDDAEDVTPPASDPYDFEMQSAEYTLDPGEERYICTTMRVPEAVNLQDFAIGDYVGVHHMFFAKSIVPGEDGVFDCPELFRVTWLPLFTTGNGATTLELPEGSAFELEADDQLVMQLHLTNTTAEPLTERVTVQARTLPNEELESVSNLYAFGTTQIDIPARSKHVVTHDCVMKKNLDTFVLFPHMHYLGERVTFEVGPSEEQFETVYDGSWNFDEQELIPTDIQLREGDFTRLSCHYDNPFDHPVGYGESTFEEMCFFSFFAQGGDPLDGCVDLSGGL